MALRSAGTGPPTSRSMPTSGNRRGLPVAAVVTIGVLLLVAIAVAAWLLIGGDDDPVEGADPITFAVPDGPATEVPAVRITVSASSYLPPNTEAGLTYGPENLIDASLDTAWNSVTGPEEGRGETLVFRFSEPVELKTIRFVNGYTRTETAYRANHRVRSMTLVTDGSTEPSVVELLDIMESQEIASDFGLTSKVELQVTDIYPGDGFSDPALTTDLALTEVTFFAVQR